MALQADILPASKLLDFFVIEKYYFRAMFRPRATQNYAGSEAHSESMRNISSGLSARNISARFS
jgi:hypothetical protein